MNVVTSSFLIYDSKTAHDTTFHHRSSHSWHFITAKDHHYDTLTLWHIIIWYIKTMTQHHYDTSSYHNLSLYWFKTYNFIPLLFICQKWKSHIDRCHVTINIGLGSLCTFLSQISERNINYCWTSWNTNVIFHIWVNHDPSPKTVSFTYTSLKIYLLWRATSQEIKQILILKFEFQFSSFCLFWWYKVFQGYFKDMAIFTWTSQCNHQPFIVRNKQLRVILSMLK